MALFSLVGLGGLIWFFLGTPSVLWAYGIAGFVWIGLGVVYAFEIAVKQLSAQTTFEADSFSAVLLGQHVVEGVLSVTPPTRFTVSPARRRAALHTTST